MVQVDDLRATVVLLHGATDAGREWINARRGHWGSDGRILIEAWHVADVVNGARSDGLWVEKGGTL